MVATKQAPQLAAVASVTPKPSNWRSTVPLAAGKRSGVISSFRSTGVSATDERPTNCTARLQLQAYIDWVEDSGVIVGRSSCPIESTPRRRSRAGW